MAEPKRAFDWARAVSAWGPVVIYMAGISLASAQETMPLEGRTALSDKEIHAIAYLGLLLLAYRAATMIPLRSAVDPVFQAFFVTILHGALDEGHQYFVPGRQCDLCDFLADVTGALIAVLAIVSVRILTRKGGTKNVRRRERQ